MVIDLFDKQLRWGNLCSPLECSCDKVPEVFFAHEIIVSMEFGKVCKFLKSVRKNSISCYSGHVENFFDKPANFFAKVGKINDQMSKKLHSNREKQIGILPREFFSTCSSGHSRC